MSDTLNAEVVEQLPEQEVYFLLCRSKGGAWWCAGNSSDTADLTGAMASEQYWKNSGYETKIGRVMVPR